MYSIELKSINRQYANRGQHDEQRLAYTLTGKIRTHDHVAFDVDSDIPEFHMSVKSEHFTLVSSKLMHSQDFMGQIAEYFDRVASTCWAYVVEDVAYIMDKQEFRDMLLAFGKFERESEKNGGGYKVRFPNNNKKIMAWLTAQI